MLKDMVCTKVKYEKRIMPNARPERWRQTSLCINDYRVYHYAVFIQIHVAAQISRHNPYNLLLTAQSTYVDNLQAGVNCRYLTLNHQLRLLCTRLLHCSINVVVSPESWTITVIGAEGNERRMI